MKLQTFEYVFKVYFALEKPHDPTGTFRKEFFIVKITPDAELQITANISEQTRLALISSRINRHRLPMFANV